MIDRQRLIATLDRFDVRPPVQYGGNRYSFREDLADAILELEGGDHDAAEERPEPQSDQLEHPAGS